jgi:hypothetical protein
MFAEEERSSLTFSTPELMRQSELSAFNKPVSSQKDPDAVLRKLLYPSSPKKSIDESASVMGRATHAASQVLITRDESGKSRLNTSYLLRALTSVAADSASTPYWRRRSAGEPLSDFGSTVGNDAGMNVLHALAPGIQQMVKSHAPKFVARLAQRIGRN